MKLNQPCFPARFLSLETSATALCGTYVRDVNVGGGTYDDDWAQCWLSW